MQKKQMLDEGYALNHRFSGLNRSKFAQEHGIPGGAAMIYQHINGLRPISFEAANAYARAFGVPIGEISARFSPEGPLPERPEAQGIHWPYPRIDFDKLVALTGTEARNLENAILAAAADVEIDIKWVSPGRRRTPAAPPTELQSPEKNHETTVGLIPKIDDARPQGLAQRLDQHKDFGSPYHPQEETNAARDVGKKKGK